TVVASVGEDAAQGMKDEEIMGVLKDVDPALYAATSAIVGIEVVDDGLEEVEEDGLVEVEEEDGLIEVEEDNIEEVSDDFDDDDDGLDLEEETPATFLRRACWNKGLRCRKEYGPNKIPVAFVKSKVAVFIDGPVPDNSLDNDLIKKGWAVLHFAESDITDGVNEAEVISAAVKDNLRKTKKPKKTTVKKRR
ncbi:MAG: very short patch repair endonuclease, partial [archaeon]|nr:very short patch repair endonuclease [archaeon]